MQTQLNFSSGIRDTSRISYLEEKIKGLGKDQQMVLEAIEKLGQCTDREICDYLGLDDPNKVRPRRFELVKAGKIKASEYKRRCRITGKLAIVWQIS